MSDMYNNNITNMYAVYTIYELISMYNNVQPALKYILCFSII